MTDILCSLPELDQTAIKRYAYNQSDGREDLSSAGNRVLRGGSWGSNSVAARTAYRDFNHSPDKFADYLGFRLAWSSTGSC